MNFPIPAAPSGSAVQRVNAVESVSNVGVVWTDKAGTLTDTTRYVWHANIVTGPDVSDANQHTQAMSRMVESITFNQD